VVFISKRTFRLRGYLSTTSNGWPSIAEKRRESIVLMRCVGLRTSLSAVMSTKSSLDLPEQPVYSEYTEIACFNKADIGYSRSTVREIIFSA
jgi:hypothetical protein